jgi:hypothetical protein
LRRALKDPTGQLNRNAWEMGLALAIKDALRSGDLYVPQSKQHVSFWDLTLSDTRWQEVKTSACDALEQPQKAEAKGVLANSSTRRATWPKRVSRSTISPRLWTASSS